MFIIVHVLQFRFGSVTVDDQDWQIIALKDCKLTKLNTVTNPTLPCLLFDVHGVQGVVESSLGSFVRLPGFHQVHCDPHVDTDNLQTYYIHF